MKILKNFFDKTSGNEDIYKYTLVNDKETQVSFINFGGYIIEILTKDKNYQLENIVLAYDDLKSYENDTNYFGCLVGRVAGRITKGKAVIEGKEYKLPKNDNEINHLHGGFKGFNKKVWNVEEGKNDNEIYCILRYISKDGEENYPGNLNVEVKYSLNNDNEFTIEYNATTDKTTIINMTNHSNFNLSGNYKENIEKHLLYINGDQYVKISDNNLPDNDYSNVKNTVFDFRTEKPIEKAIKSNDSQIEKVNRGIDHPFVLRKEKPQVILKDLKSGRILEMETSTNCAVIYTSNFVDESVSLKYDKRGIKHLGICIEAQNLPDAINKEKFPSIILKPEEKYNEKTIYRFKTMEEKC